MSNSSIWLIDRALSGVTTRGQSGLESTGNDGILRIPQSSRTEAWPSDDLILYPEHSLRQVVLPLSGDAVGVF